MKENIKKYLKYTPIFMIFFIVAFVLFDIKTVYATSDSGWYNLLDGTGLLDAGGFILNATLKIASEVFSWILEIVINPLLGFALTIIGNLLDQAINFSLDTKNITSITGLKVGWSIFRDFVNISFIFILLYIAISTILGMAGSKDKSVLAKLVTAALFINFSMFVTGLIIDVGNIFALALRSAIVVDSSSGGLGAIIMNVLKLAETYQPEGWGMNSFIPSIVRLVLLIISIYAFWMATLLFITRIVSFVFLIILSPIGFMGGMLPGIKKHSERWWQNLIGQVSVAPVFLFFFYIIAQLTTSSGFFLNTLPSSGGIDVTYYFNFAIVIGLILLAIKITKDISGEIGKSVVGFAQKTALTAAGIAGGAVIGASALAGRAVVGRGAAMASKKWGDTLMKTGSDENAGSFKRGMANLGLKTLRNTEKSSFDMRNTKVGASALGKVKGVKFEFGKGKDKEGFKGKMDRVSKEETKYAESLTYKDADGKIHSRAKEYGETLENPGLIASLFGRGKAEKAAAKNIIDRHNKKEELKKLNKEKKKINREIKDIDDTLRIERAKKEPNEYILSGSKRDRKKLYEELDKVEIEIEKIKEGKTKSDTKLKDSKESDK